MEGLSGLDKAGKKRMQICEGVGVAETSHIKMSGVSHQPTTNACCTLVGPVPCEVKIYAYVLLFNLIL